MLLSYHVIEANKFILYQKIVLKSDKLRTALETKTLQEAVVSAKPF